MSPAPQEIFPEMLRARGADQAHLLRLACQARNRTRGAKVFIRAVVEVSNYCRQNCSYCGMRRSNRDLQRFRLEKDQLRRIVFESLPSSVTDVNFQGGEDPVVVRELILPLVAEIAAQTGLGISLCLGTLPETIYHELQQAGASVYIMKLETGNAELYRQLNSPGTFDQRIETIRHLAATGWNVSSGFISGLPGQNEAAIFDTIRLLASLPLAGYSVSPFIPGSDTPLQGAEGGDIHTALNALAMMRLARPSHIIPAVSAFNILDAKGYSTALRAGANLSTINLTPTGWRENYLLYKRDRFIMTEQRVLQAIEEAGCEPSGTSLVKTLGEKQAA